MFNRITDMLTILNPSDALAGRQQPIATASHHFVNDNPLHPPFPGAMRQILFGMGCFWGAERIFWSLDGVYVTAVGYTAGLTPNPTYEEVCTGRTGHNEAVLVVYEPAQMELEQLLKIFWESHDPTQGMRQGGDRGTQHRSGIYTFDEGQLVAAIASKSVYQQSLQNGGYGNITTEILEADKFYYAEAYHQQYLAKNPTGYCGIGGTGIACAVSLAG